MSVNLVRKLPLRTALTALSWLRRQYFDWRHNVHTVGDVPLNELDPVTGTTALSVNYQPTHPRAARRLLSELPVVNLEDYTFVDLGSGKGLTLCVAAEFPFRRIVGVEFSRHLHAVACRNIQTYRNRRRRCLEVASINLDARQYQFPLDPLVVFMFNPFRGDLLSSVLENLDRSLDEEMRDVMLLYLTPYDAHLVDMMRNMRFIGPGAVPPCNLYRSLG